MIYVERRKLRSVTLVGVVLFVREWLEVMGVIGCYFTYIGEMLKGSVFDMYIIDVLIMYFNKK